MYDHIKNDLRTAYAKKVAERNSKEMPDWKLKERSSFLAELLGKKQPHLLEVGAGTGQDSQFFQEKGVDVTCIDLSPANVKMCQDKGLNAQVMDVCQLKFSENCFDAVFSFNCLLHLPKDKFPIALEQIRFVLKQEGLFYLGLYGGYDFAGTWERDSYEPKRFYSFYADEQIEMILKKRFDLLSFKKIPSDDGDAQVHFQSFLLRKS